MSGPSPDDVRRLLDITAIQHLKAAYLRCLDERDYDGLEQVLWSDVIVRGSREVFTGCAAFREFLEAPGNRPDRTVHLGLAPEIHLDGDVATGTWRLMALAQFTPGEGGAEPRSSVSFGRYHDRYERRGGEWRIASFELRLDVPSVDLDR